MRWASILGPTSWSLLILFVSFALADSLVDEQSLEAKSEDVEKPKLLPIFSVVRFPNDNCEGDQRNGTCYTAEECSNKGGSKSGECASGFGVCCIFTLSCGQSSSENCTYLVQAATTSFTNTLCDYKICKCSSNICRIRYDFVSMEINEPVLDTTAGSALIVAGQTGDCTSDTITFTGVNQGPPIICGFNTGQHLYVDATDDCHHANFNMDTASSSSRKWDVKVTQYDCGSEHGGPPGCLQYFTSTSGTVKNFAYPATLSATTTHLSSQDYQMCFRRASGNCFICFVPSITITGANTAAAQTSFGLSASPNAIAQSAVDTQCSLDFLELPGATTSAIAAMTATILGAQRICGRVWNNAAGQAVANTISVCTRRVPFRMRFRTDDNEVALTTGTPAANTAENAGAPGGIVGFSLDFKQTAC